MFILAVRYPFMTSREHAQVTEGDAQADPGELLCLPSARSRGLDVSSGELEVCLLFWVNKASIGQRIWCQTGLVDCYQSL